MIDASDSLPGGDRYAARAGGCSARTILAIAVAFIVAIAPGGCAAEPSAIVTIINSADRPVDVQINPAWQTDESCSPWNDHSREIWSRRFELGTGDSVRIERAGGFDEDEVLSVRTKGDDASEWTRASMRQIPQTPFPIQLPQLVIVEREGSLRVEVWRWHQIRAWEEERRTAREVATTP